jgi:outer membrane scaffolding protein for murein synthesis (MipA/OmpV family)
MIKTIATAALLSMLGAATAHAQTEKPKKEPLRVRVGAGAQLVPTFPGSSDIHVSPYPDFAIARGKAPFVFEAPDESFGFPVKSLGGIEVGPAGTFQGARRRRDTIAPMDEVGFSIEAGAFAQFWIAPKVRLRVEGRRGLSGHRAWVGSVGADYVVRDGDNYVFSIGPRVNLSDSKYQAAYFGVNPGESARTGLPVYRPKGGAHSVGAIAGATYSLGGRWGAVGYVRYDRLVGDAAASPFIAAHGARDQMSGGLGLTYTFGKR